MYFSQEFYNSTTNVFTLQTSDFRNELADKILSTTTVIPFKVQTVI